MLLCESSRLNTISMGLDPDSHEQWNTVARMFQSLPSSTRLQTIDIAGVIEPSSDELLGGLEALDQFVENALFEKLKTFTLWLRYAEDVGRIDSLSVGPAVLEVARSKVPKLFAQRRCQVRFNLAEMRPPGGSQNWFSVFDFSSSQ